MSGKNSLDTLSTLDVKGKSYDYYSLPKAAKSLGNIDKLPASMKVCWKTCYVTKMAKP